MYNSTAGRVRGLHPAKGRSARPRITGRRAGAARLSIAAVVRRTSMLAKPLSQRVTLFAPSGVSIFKQSETVPVTSRFAFEWPIGCHLNNRRLKAANPQGRALEYFFGGKRRKMKSR